MKLNNTRKLNEEITTQWHNKGAQILEAGCNNFGLCAQQKHKPHFLSHFRGVGHEHWQSFYVPSAT